jgi:hypothetical protein
LHEIYHWTKSEIDETDLIYLLDLIVLRDKISAAEKYTPIDQIL